MVGNPRFEFGKNWTRFLALIDEERIIQAEESLKNMLKVKSLKARKFLDIGSGSGLFSLAARRMGARVLSFDLDVHSVGCTQSLKESFLPKDPNWTICQGSVLDKSFLESLGKFDVVYSWGVLHHTGAMWEALGNLPPLLNPGGKIFIAVYNDQGWKSRFWKSVKKIYNRTLGGKTVIVIFFAPFFITGRFLFRLLRKSPTPERGMSLWYDMFDWLGGYPFEVAKPEDIFEFFHNKGLVLTKLKTAGCKLGCNEYVFQFPELKRPGE
jgi:2-polyprenyl-3-methyl-5-hydroxy-6-metoxy-1,4-benzoquinol methylase